MNKIKRILKFSGLVIVVLSIMAMPVVILNGWNMAVGWMEWWWINEKAPIAQNLTYKAPRLWELSVDKQIKKVFGKDAPMALAIAQAESGMRCEAISHTGDVSVFQINKIHSRRGNILDCTTNILIAKQIFDEQGWTPWVVYNTGAYKKFLSN